MAQKSRDMTHVALMVVLLAVCAWISVPAPVPFTLQTFGVFCSLTLLGPRKGAAAIGVYLAMGVIGLPVFSGFAGGAGQLLGATGGYLLGFLPMAGVYALVKRLGGRDVLALGLGLALCYAFGTFWYTLVYTHGNLTGLGSAFLWCVAPFIVPDGAKMALALWLSRILKQHITI